jgi:hypothetical protein
MNKLKASPLNNGQSNLSGAVSQGDDVNVSGQTTKKELIQISKAIPYKMMGQLFIFEDKKKAVVPVFKLELCSKGETIGGTAKPVRYATVH